MAIRTGPVTAPSPHPALDDTAIADLSRHFRGPLIRPGDALYDAGRRVWNGAIDRRPALIARCTGVADVRTAVGFARERELVVAVRGGGHNVAGTAVCDGGVVIDLSPMKGIWVDPRARVARAQPGLLWGEVDRETQSFGLAAPGGIVSHTGIAGLTLGGGLGWLMRRHGLTADNLVSADVVTADGALVRASADENADLFWGSAVAEGTSASSRRSSIACMPSGRRCLPASSCIPRRGPVRSSRPTATTSRARRTR